MTLVFLIDLLFYLIPNTILILTSIQVFLHPSAVSSLVRSGNKRLVSIVDQAHSGSLPYSTTSSLSPCSVRYVTQTATFAGGYANVLVYEEQ